MASLIVWLNHKFLIATYLKENSSSYLFKIVVDLKLTCGTAEEILVPPAAPTTKTASPSELTTINGLIDDRGIFPGAMKFSGEGGISKALVILGAEKSSISSFKIIPVLIDLTLAPKL